MRIAGAGMRGAALAAVLMSACARIENPPGGPPDAAPPQIVGLQPESGAVVPDWKDEVVIQFDDVIDEMATGGPVTGAAGLARFVLLSPAAGGVRVEWHRDKITVKPREGWKRRVYRLEVLPGILDLRRNRLDSSRVALFTTGPAIGHARIGGIALGWIEQRILPNALIEAVPLPDSVGYLTLADSGGQFNLEGLAPGRYIVYASVDENGDRRRGLREAYDSAAVTLDSSANTALYAFVHDTNPPRLRAANPTDSVTIRLEFSQPLDPSAPLDTARLRVLELPDSTPVPLATVVPQRQYDSLAAAARARADSAARDTTARDTAAAAPRVPPPAPPPRQTPDTQRVDTALVRRLLALRPVPANRFVRTLARPMKPETRYVVQVRGATNLVGRRGDAQVTLLAPKPAAADTTRPRQPPPPPQPPPRQFR